MLKAVRGGCRRRVAVWPVWYRRRKSEAPPRHATAATLRVGRWSWSELCRRLHRLYPGCVTCWRHTGVCVAALT